MGVEVGSGGRAVRGSPFDIPASGNHGLMLQVNVLFQIGHVKRERWLALVNRLEPVLLKLREVKPLLLNQALREGIVDLCFNHRLQVLVGHRGVHSELVHYSASFLAAVRAANSWPDFAFAFSYASWANSRPNVLA